MSSAFERFTYATYWVLGSEKAEFSQATEEFKKLPKDEQDDWENRAENLRESYELSGLVLVLRQDFEELQKIITRISKEG